MLSLTSPLKLKVRLREILIPKVMKPGAWNCFGKNVRGLINRRDVFDNKQTLDHLFWNKNKSSSTCLVRACRIGLADSIIVLRLSHDTFGGLDKWNFSSESTDDIHVNSATRCTRLPYAASVLDLDMTCCFLDCHDIRLEPR